MSNVVEKLQTINSFIRTIVALVVVGVAGTAGWYGYSTYMRGERAEKDLELARQELEKKQLALEASQRRIAEQADQIADLNREVERLDLAVRMHRMQRRLAQIEVLDVEQDPETKQTFSRIAFTELSETGEPMGEPREFRLKGDLIYIDCLVAKFEDKYVERADLERGASICMFNRIFGEFQQPQEGFSLDEPGRQPGAYSRGGRISELEKKIWNDFWSIANDPAAAAELGIRTIHGDAVSIKVVKGKTYRVVIRASGGPEIEVGESEAENDNVPRTAPGSYS